MTPPSERHLQILAFYDALQDKDPAVVARALPCSLGTVYAVLRHYRPGRKRKARPKTSGKKVQILGLVARGHKVARVAELVQVSRTYVYRVIAERAY